MVVKAFNHSSSKSKVIYDPEYHKIIICRFSSKNSLSAMRILTDGYLYDLYVTCINDNSPELEETSLAIYLTSDIPYLRDLAKRSILDIAND